MFQPHSDPQTPAGGLIRITTHPRPDLDALAAAWGLSFILQRPAWLFFNDRPNPEDHNPALGQFVVDVGGGPLDHHFPSATGTKADRTTCAFLKVCAWAECHTDQIVRFRAEALRRQLGPTMLRQDATGSIASPGDPVAEALALPKLISALHRRLNDDLAVAKAVQPWLETAFESALGHDKAERSARTALPLAARLPAPEIIILVYRHTQGEMDLLRDVAWREHPAARVMYYETTHVDATGAVQTVSRGLSRRRGDPLDMSSLVKSLLSCVSLPVAAELRLWHCEPWFAGRGSLKYPQPVSPPATMSTEIAAALAQMLEHRI